MTKYEDIMKALRKGEYAPVYILCGEEPYYINRVAEYVENHVLDGMAREFDQLVLYGKDLEDSGIDTAVSAARGFPMMGGHKVIIVKEAQMIHKWEALGKYVKTPQPSTLLVICYKYGTPDLRLAAFRNFEENGGVWMESKRLKDYQIEPWIRNYVAQRDAELREKGDSVQIDERVAKLLADSIGAELEQIAGALQKLIDGRPEGVTKIDADLVERNIGISKDFNVFELQDALVRGDVLKANRIAQYFAKSKDHPLVKEIGILFNFFANLMVYHYLEDKSDRAVAAALNISPYFAKDYAAAARRYSAGKTFAIIGYFRDIDAKSKGLNNASAKDDDLWKELIYKILH